MNDLKVFRWTGAFGVATFVLVLAEFPLYISRGPTPLLQDTTKYANFMTKNSGNVLTCVVLDMLIFVGILVFLAGFRHLIRQARADYEWLATLVFGVARRQALKFAYSRWTYATVGAKFNVFTAAYQFTWGRGF
jgi:hypothetical protein